MIIENNRIEYREAAKKVAQLKLVIVGQDPYPKGSNGIAFCKNTFDDLFDQYCCGKDVLFSLGYTEEMIRSDFSSPTELFFHLLSNGIAFINVSSVLLDVANDESIKDDIKYNSLFLDKAASLVILGKSKAMQLFKLNYPKHDIEEAIIHPSGKVKEFNKTEWNNKWAQPYLKKEFLDNFNTKELRMELEKYFDLTIENKELYSAGEVLAGKHGIEIIGGEYYASLYHLQKHIAKGKLKDFLSDYVGAKMLGSLGLKITKEFPFKSLKVQYKSHGYEINKYPYKAVLKYFLKHTKEANKLFIKTLEDVDSVGLKSISFENFKRFKELKPIDIGKINFFVGKNNAGKSSVVEGLMLMRSFLKQNNFNSLDLDSVELSNKLGITSDSLLHKSTELYKISGSPHFYLIDINVSFDDSHFYCGFLETEKKPITGVFKMSNNYFSIAWDHPLIRQVPFSDGNEEENSVTIRMKDSGITVDEMALHADVNDLNGQIYKVEKTLEREKVKRLKKEKGYKFKRKLGGHSEIEQKLIDLENSLKKKLSATEKLLRNSLNDKVVLSDYLEFPVDVHDKSIQDILTEINAVNKNMLKNPGNESEGDRAFRKEFDARYSRIFESVENLFSRIKKTSMHYLEGTAIKSGPVITNNGNEKGLFQSIKYLFENNVFGKSKKTGDHEMVAFIKKWVGYEEGFEIGNDFSVEDLNGEAFSVIISSDITNTHNKQFLSDVGLGSQRLVELILGVAKVIHEKQKHSLSYEPLVLVEEPEAHLHPALQSKLTEFFYAVNREYDIRFIIETHSEYIVRKSQLIALEENLLENEELNPFNVIYFDQEKGPYAMKYLDNGKFDRPFGSGFYDESDEIALKLYRHGKKNK